MCATILVPFDDLLNLQATFCRALELAETLEAEVILLRVNLPDSSLSQQTHDAYSQADLYRELKALQAQCASYPTAVRIETTPGPPEKAIIRYAARHQVDLILSTQIASLLDRHIPAALSGGAAAQRQTRPMKPRSGLSAEKEALAHV